MILLKRHADTLLLGQMSASATIPSTFIYNRTTQEDLISCSGPGSSRGSQSCAQQQKIGKGASIGPDMSINLGPGTPRIGVNNS